jgi:hypothetical protein
LKLIWSCPICEAEERTQSETLPPIAPLGSRSK